MPSQVNAAISLLRVTIHAHGTWSNINRYLRFYYYAVVEVWIVKEKSECLPGAAHGRVAVSFGLGEHVALSVLGHVVEVPVRCRRRVRVV